MCKGTFKKVSSLQRRDTCHRISPVDGPPVRLRKAWLNEAGPWEGSRVSDPCGPMGRVKGQWPLRAHGKGAGSVTLRRSEIQQRLRPAKIFFAKLRSGPVGKGNYEKRSKLRVRGAGSPHSRFGPPVRSRKAWLNEAGPQEGSRASGPCER